MTMQKKFLDKGQKYNFIIAAVFGLAVCLMLYAFASSQSNFPETQSLYIKLPEPKPLSEELKIKNALAKYKGVSSASVSFAVGQEAGGFARGSVNFQGEAEWAFWLAVNTENAWKVVFIGNGMPACDELLIYNFPKDILPECFVEEQEEG